MTVEPNLGHLRLRLSRNLYHSDEEVKGEEGMEKPMQVWSKTRSAADPRSLSGSGTQPDVQQDTPIV